MPAMDLTSPFDPRIDQLSQKIQEIRSRSTEKRDTTMDDAMDVVETNSGRKEATQAEMSMQGLTQELAAQGAAMHSFDPARVADLISDPFED